eukprot:gene27398-36170_t
MLVKERNLFLKAALQMLDSNASNNSVANYSYPNSINSNNHCHGDAVSLPQTKRTIPLTADSLCQIYHLKTAMGYNVFELKTPGAPRRLWMLSSAGAVTGVGLGFPITLQPAASNPVAQPVSGYHTEKKLSKRLRDGFSSPMLSGNGFWAQKPLPTDVRPLSNPLTSVDASLRESEDPNHPTLTSRSQDLQRDAIRINNENVSGACDMGAENILGALLRHISDKVEFARSQVFSQERSSSQRLSPKERGVSVDGPQPPNAVNVNEADMLSFASDILMMSNRTQKQICILTPLSSESDPVDMKVDLVWTKVTHRLTSNSYSSDAASYSYKQSTEEFSPTQSHSPIFAGVTSRAGKVASFESHGSTSHLFTSGTLLSPSDSPFSLASTIHSKSNSPVKESSHTRGSFMGLETTSSPTKGKNMGPTFSHSKSRLSNNSLRNNVPISSESSDDYGDIHNDEDFLDNMIFSPKSPEMDQITQPKASANNKAIQNTTHSKVTQRNKSHKTPVVGTVSFFVVYVPEAISPPSTGNALKGKHRKSASMSALNNPNLMNKMSDHNMGKDIANSHTGTAKARLVNKGNLAPPSSSSSSDNLIKQSTKDPIINTAPSRRTHRNSYSISFDQPSEIPTDAIHTTVVQSTTDSAPLTSHRNQLNLSDLLECNSLAQSNNSKHKDSLTKASTALYLTTTNEASLSLPSFDEQDSSSSRSASRVPVNISIKSNDPRLGRSQDETTLADESSSVFSEITFESAAAQLSRSRREPLYLATDFSSYNKPNSNKQYKKSSGVSNAGLATVSDDGDAGAATSTRKLWVPPSLQKAKTEHLQHDPPVDLETPSKPHTAVKNRKTLKILMMKSMNMFTPAKANNVSTSQELNYGGSEDPVVSQTSENMPNLFGRLRGLGSSSADGGLATVGEHTGPPESRSRRNSDGTPYNNGPTAKGPFFKSNNLHASTSSKGSNPNPSIDLSSGNVSDTNDDDSSGFNNSSLNNKEEDRIRTITSTSYFVRVEVNALSRYKICDDALDNWAHVSGNFSQSFFIDLETCRLAISDRLITIQGSSAHRNDKK